ncbi:MAG: hypothetical protein DLM72_14390 [Candidatus Nitrosopolaris wilkensis]|nr:MAG: hypothetical protein DLM72_14390 [Candidatus Nitrosopolaris wilkensis]
MIDIFLIIALLVVANSTQVLENQIKQLQAQVAAMTTSLQQWEQYLLRQSQQQAGPQNAFPPSQNPPQQLLTQQQPPSINPSQPPQLPPSAQFNPQSTKSLSSTVGNTLAAHGQNLTTAVESIKKTQITAHQNVTGIAGLNAQNIQNYQDNLVATTDTARLHHASNATLAIFANQQQVLSCVYLYFNLPDKSTCNDLVTGYLVDNGLGDNQTMINIAKAYLKVNGVQ